MPENQGEHACDAKRTSKDDPLYNIPESQNFASTRNVDLDRLYSQDVPFALWVNWESFLDEPIPEDEMAEFVGYAWFKTREETRLEDKELEQLIETEGLTGKNARLAAFRLQKHRKLHVAFLFGTEEYNLLSEKNNNDVSRFKRLQLRLDGPDHMDIPVSVKQVNQGTITRTTVINSYIESGMHLKFDLENNTNQHPNKGTFLRRTADPAIPRLALNVTSLLTTKKY